MKFVLVSRLVLKRSTQTSTGPAAVVAAAAAAAASARDNSEAKSKQKITFSVDRYLRLLLKVDFGSRGQRGIPNFYSTLFKKSTLR